MNKLPRLIEWLIRKFGPVQFAITRNRNGQWKLALVTGSLRYLPPAYSTLADAEHAYDFVSKEVKNGARKSHTSRPG